MQMDSKTRQRASSCGHASGGEGDTRAVERETTRNQSHGNAITQNVPLQNNIRTSTGSNA
jgi:hypothetical protein